MITITTNTTRSTSQPQKMTCVGVLREREDGVMFARRCRDGCDKVDRRVMSEVQVHVVMV